MEPTELDQMIDQALAENVPDEVHAYLADEWTVSYGDHFEPAGEPDEWQIDGERTATWCARRLGMAEAERAAAKVEADRLRALADEYESRVARRTERTIAYMLGRLRLWHDGILAEQPRRLTVDLPGYRLRRRAGTVSTEVTDAEAFTAWATDRDDDATYLDYPDPKIKKAAVKAAFAGKVSTDPGTFPAVDEATGEVVPGIAFTRAVPSETVVPVGPTGTDEGGEA